MIRERAASFLLKSWRIASIFQSRRAGLKHRFTVSREREIHFIAMIGGRALYTIGLGSDYTNV